MLINDNTKKPSVAVVGTANPADVDARMPSLLSEGSMLPSAILAGSSNGNGNGSSNVSNINNTISMANSNMGGMNYSAPSSRHRSSFDTNSKIGSFAHANDHMKSPYLSAFPAFRQSSFGNGFDNAGSLLQSPPQSQPVSQLQPPSSSGSGLGPPLSSPSMLLSSYNNNNNSSNGIGKDLSNTSPLSPQKSSFSDVPPLSQDMFTSPLTKPYEFLNQPRLSFTGTNPPGTSMGIFPNIEELALDNFDSIESKVGDVGLMAPLQSQYDQLNTRSSIGSVWGDTNPPGSANRNAVNDTRNSAGSLGFQLQNTNNGLNWASPPLADFQPMRRYSYDAASAATFIPNTGTLANYDFNLNIAANYMKSDANNHNNNSSSGNNSNNGISKTGNNNNNGINKGSNDSSNNMRLLSNNYSRHSSVGANVISQFNNISHSSNIISPTKEQVIRSINDVSNYLGVPSPEVLNIEKYLSHLNTSSLPQLTYLADSTNLSNYEIIACCFKNSRIDVFHISPINKQLLGELKVGDLVIVEADRGRDLGKVVKLNVSVLEARLLRYAQYLGRKAALSKEDENHKRPVLNFPKPVIRFAKNEELLTINSKISDEIRAVEVCQNKVAEYNLDMKIVDAEYQWDMKKLTFYYTSEVRIDFRDLVKELFRIYKIRIWMSKQGGIC